MEDRIVIAKCWKWGKRCSYRHEGSRGVWTVQYFECSVCVGGGTSTYTAVKIVWNLHTHTQISTSRTGKIWISLDCVNVSILVVVLYYSVANCYHWGKLGKVFKEFLLCVISCNCMWIYNYLDKNFNLKKPK